MKHTNSYVGGGKEMKPQVGPNLYFCKSYDTKERFISYWHQIDEVIKLNPKKALEIGVGNSFVSNYLKKRGINLITLDIDKRLNPDVLGSILQLPFPSAFFDVIICYEILEHLPYKDFNMSLSEIYRVSKSHAIFSIPDVTKVYRFNIQIPKIGEIKRLIPLFRLRNPVHKFYGEHYWEIGKAGYPFSKITKDIQKSGFKIEKTYRVFENPYHRFFILRKIEKGNYDKTYKGKCNYSNI